MIGIEEATTLTARKYQDITTCCRTSKPNWLPRIYSTTNPGGVGHAWYRTKFIVPFQRKQETETRFIPARVNGWAEVMQGFGEVAVPPANGSPDQGTSEGFVRPPLFIHPRCARLIETLPALQHDPNRPEDVLKVDADEDGVGAMIVRTAFVTWWRRSRERSRNGSCGDYNPGVRQLPALARRRPMVWAEVRVQRRRLE